MELLYVIPLAVFVTGLSAVALARRAPVPCTACGEGRLAAGRDFMFRCTSCGAVFRRQQGTLELVAHAPVELPRAFVVHTRAH